MKAHVLIRENGGLLRHLRNANITTDDIDKLNLYDEYTRLLNEGNKKLYIVSCLSDAYKVSDRQIYNIINKMEREIAWTA
jgi:hypothetical protein